MKQYLLTVLTIAGLFALVSCSNMHEQQGSKPTAKTVNSESQDFFTELSGLRLPQHMIEANRPAYRQSLEAQIDFITSSGRPMPAFLALLEASLGCSLAEDGMDQKAGPHLRRAMFPRDKRLTPDESEFWIVLHWLWIDAESRGDDQALNELWAAVPDRLPMAEEFTASKAALTQRGVSKREVVAFEMGMYYVASGIDYHRGLIRGRQAIQAVATNHPTEPILNLTAAFWLENTDANAIFARRAYRHGNANVRAALMATKTGATFYGANQEARAMGHPYDKRFFSHLHIRGDGSSYVTED